MPTAFDDLLTDAPTTQAEAAQGGFDDLLDDAPPQSPLETGVRSFAMAPGQTAATAMSGVGRVRQALSDTIGTRLPSAIAPIAKGAFDVATTVPRLLGPLATDIAAEHERVYNPDATRNPNAAAVGSGMGQMLPMAASAIVAGPAAPLALGAAQGADQGIAQAEEMGITDPARKLAMGAAYAGTEAAIEKIGGVGSKAFTDAAKRTFGQAVKEGVKTMASEAGEEPLTGAIQDAIAARFAPDTYDVTPLAPVIPSVEGDTWEFNPQFWNRRKLETVGGGAGGFAAGTIQIAQNATQPSQPADATAQPAADVTPDPLAAHAQTMPSPAAPDYTQPSRPNYDDPGAMWGEMLTDQPPPMEGQVVEFAPPTTRAEDTANETATTEGSGLLDDPLGNPAVSIPPPATPAEAQTQAQESNVSVTSPPASEVTIPPAETRTEAPVVPTTDAGSTPATGGNYQGPAFGSTAPAMTREVPVIPDAPYGGRDVLDFVNDNPIAAPEPILDVIHEKKGAVLTPQQSGDYNWLKQGSVPKAYRKYFFTASSDGKSNINEVAQHAHDEGLIDDPTPDALMAKINEVIAARENYTSATKARDTQMAQQEKQTIAFDKAQAKLAKAKSNPGTRIGWDQMFPGDAMVIDGERVEVSTVDTDEDGYPTRVVLRGGEKFGTQTFDASVAGNGVLVNEWQPQPRRTIGFTNLEVDGETGGFLNTEIIREATDLLARGVRDFAAWSKAMLSKFGEAIRTHLGTIWKHVQAEAKMLTTNKGSVGGDAISNRQTEPIRMTHAAEAERMAAEGKEPLPTGGQGTVEEWEAEARARVQQPGAAQALVADIIEKQRTHTPAEYYMLMHYAGALDAQMERLSQTVADPQTSEQERSQAAAILPGLDTERDRVAVAAQIAGSKAGAALGARSRGLERAVIPSLSKMVADLTLIDDPTGRRPLPPEERARIEKIHGEMTEKAAAVEKQEEKASTDSLHAELKKLLDEAHAEIAAQKEQIEIQQRALDNKLKPATLLTKTKATLTKWADDGEAALDELRAKGFFAQTNMAVDPSVILATARVIRGYMAKNAMKSGDAAAIIIKKLGHQAYAALEKFLPQILDKVKQIQAEELKKPTRENVIEKARKEMPKPGETAKVDPAQPMPAKATGKLDTLPALARKLALAHIIDHLERGDATMSAEKIAELVRADLEEFKPGITTREARDAISGYGDVKLPNKDIARKTMRDFRAQMQKLTQLEALMAQERLLKSGVQRDQPSARLRELQKQVEELKRQTGYESRSREDELRSARDRIKTSLNNQIEELQRILAGKARPAAGKERVIYDAELQSLQTMRNALKDLVAEMPEHKRASETRRNKAALKAAKAIEAEYKRRLAAEEWHARRTTATPSPELAAARADAAKARNAFEQARKSRTGDTTGMQRAREQLAAAEKRVAEWQRRARDQQWTSPEAQPKAQGGRFAQVEAAKAMARQARAEFESLKKASDPRYNPDAVALRDFKRRIQQQITDLETRMAKGDFEPRKKTPREIKHDEQSKRLKHELQMTKRKWEETKLAHKLNNLSMPKKGWWYFRKAFHTSRSIMTGGEFSGLLRQGLLKTVSHPMRVMGNDIPAMIKAFRSEAGEFSVLSDIMTRPNALNGRYQTAKLAIDDPSDFSSQIAEGNARSDWLQQMSEWQSGLSGKVFHSTIGLAPRFINATGRAYTALLNHMRADLFDMMVDKLEAKKTTKGQALTEAELKAVADFVNDTTGAGKLGVIDNRPGAKDLMGMLIFAPAFVSSRIRTLFGASLIGGSMDTRQAIAGEYLRITAGMAAMFALAAALQSSTDDKPEEDPRSSNFGKVKYGKTAMDLTAGLGNTAVMIARTLMGEIKKQNGQIQPTRGEGVPYGGTTAGDVVGRWMRSKLSPGAGFTWNRITGTDYSGHPASFTTDTANLLKPITYSDVAEIWRSQPPARAVPLSAAAMLGFGTQTATDRPPMR